MTPLPTDPTTLRRERECEDGTTTQVDAQTRHRTVAVRVNSCMSPSEARLLSLDLLDAANEVVCKDWPPAEDEGVDL